MKNLRGEEGAALVTALLLTMLSLVIATTLLYSVTLGTRNTASHKRYRSALSAAHGGLEVLTRELVPRLFSVSVAGPLTSNSLDQVANAFSSVNMRFGVQPTCLAQKLNSATSAWDACSDLQKSPEAARSPDVTFRLQATEPGSQAFNVASKIVDTVPGNSVLGGYDLEAGGSVDWKDEAITPLHVPYLYSISVQGESGDAREKARLSVLYAY